MLTISVLMENTASSNAFACEHGLSLLLESDGATILFDTGQSPAFIDNAKRMGCDITKTNEIVLSHGHYDHTGGLAAALAHLAAGKAQKALPRLTAHPDILLERRRPPESPAGERDISIPENGRRALAAWPVTYSREPVWLREDIVFLGEIPHNHPEMCVLVGEVKTKRGYVKDTLPDDTAIAYVTGQGLIIVAGCSHSGIVNIIEHAKLVTGVNSVYAIYGGLHCKDMTPKIVEKTRAALEKENLHELCAFHCTGGALDAFHCHIRLAAGLRHTVL